MGPAPSPPPSSPPQSQNTSLQRLHHVEKRIVRVLELAGAVMEELANASGARPEAVASHCREFMQSIRDIQVTLREEIKSACSIGLLRSVITVPEYLMKSAARNWSM